MCDAAKYKVAAGAILIPLYPTLFHAICVAHFLPGCAIKVKSHFENVDQLIAKVNQEQLKIRPDKPNLLLLVARLSLLLCRGEVGWLPYIV